MYIYMYIYIYIYIYGAPPGACVSTRWIRIEANIAHITHQRWHKPAPPTANHLIRQLESPSTAS